ncbi:MAG: diguanylate cyclase [Deltaproteobacteria bacterium]|nr:diguanylate cyclase [Deltaproteobacteria bacterium]
MSEIVALIIDDNERVHQEVDDAIMPEIVDRLLHAMNPGDGIRMALEHRPDLIMLDINMPEMDGFKVCHLLKEAEATRDIPILFLTVETKVIHIAKALDCGGVDYISKPFNDIELRARVRVSLRHKQMVDLLREQARIDALTGLVNRAALDDALVAAASAHERTGQSVSLLMLDIDHFKAVNDGFGHGVGDDLLRAVGDAIRTCCRPYDVAGRFGGDEFGILFGQVEGVEGRSAARRLMGELRALELRAGPDSLVVTVSAGMITTAEMPGEFTAAEFMKAADVALYEAKRRGRNRLVIAEGPAAKA